MRVSCQLINQHTHARVRKETNTQTKPSNQPKFTCLAPVRDDDVANPLQDGRLLGGFGRLAVRVGK